uniref:Uncharacterized protein n=1 Tax=Panagrellus redivivus TaxID=6233 RepID=A0A7E4VVK3_PANRE
MSWNINHCKTYSRNNLASIYAFESTSFVCIALSTGLRPPKTQRKKNGAHCMPVCVYGALGGRASSQGNGFTISWKF